MGNWTDVVFFKSPQIKVELIYQLLMDNDLTALHNYAAKTDRLAQTPTPVSYTRHISRSLMLWLLTMPVCSVGAGCPWWITGLGTALVSLFCIFVRAIR
jgi:predicted membrane chloride channel (bestrophin family)